MMLAATGGARADIQTPDFGKVSTATSYSLNSRAMVAAAPALLRQHNPVNHGVEAHACLRRVSGAPESMGPDLADIAQRRIGLGQGDGGNEPSGEACVREREVDIMMPGC